MEGGLGVMLVGRGVEGWVGVVEALEIGGWVSMVCSLGQGMRDLVLRNGLCLGRGVVVRRCLLPILLLRGLRRGLGRLRGRSLGLPVMGLVLSWVVVVVDVGGRLRLGLGVGGGGNVGRRVWG